MTCGTAKNRLTCADCTVNEQSCGVGLWTQRKDLIVARMRISEVTLDVSCGG
jgi:hypothetical protein